MQLLRVVHTDPYPGAATSLIATAQIDHCSIAAQHGEIIASPVRILEAENIDIEAQAGCHVLHPQNWLAILKRNSDRAETGHHIASAGDCTAYSGGDNMRRGALGESG